MSVSREGERAPVAGLVELANSMMAEKDQRRLLNLIMERATAFVSAERSSLYLINEVSDELRTYIAQGLAVREIRLPLGKGVAGYVARTGETLNIDNAYACPHFDDEFDRRSGFRTRSILCVPVTARDGKTIGVLQALNKLEGTFSDDDVSMLHALASLAGTAIDNTRLHDETTNALHGLVQSLAAAVDARDPVTAGHADRVTYYSLKMGEAVGLTDQEMTVLEYSARLHDVGKIGIRDSILLKPGKFTDEEFETMKTHTTCTEEVLVQVYAFGANRFQRDIPLVAASHHERLDGSGYPRGLAGEAVPRLARIIGVADVYDALTHNRPYRDAMPTATALDVLRKDAQQKLDPQLVELFIGRECYRIERRQHVRVNAQLSIDYTLLPYDQAKARGAVQAMSIDASLGGLLFEAVESLPAGSFLSVSIHLPHVGIEVISRVMHSTRIDDHRYRIGISFVALDDDDRQMLTKCLQSVD